MFNRVQAKISANSDIDLSKSSLAVTKDLTVPTNKQLEQAYHFLMSQTYKGVEGVLKLDSGKPGPAIAVCACTHGNEISGLAPVWHEYQNEFFSKNLVRGSLVFIVNNAEAARSAFASLHTESFGNHRFVDLNMNRLPERITDANVESTYELRRLKQLFPVFQEVEAALDIHSTSLDSPPMLIAIKGDSNVLMRGMPAARILSGIVEVQVGVPIGSYIGTSGCEAAVFEIETGGHLLESSRQRSLQGAITFAKNASVLDVDYPVLEDDLYEYKVTSSVLFPDESYELVEAFADFSPVAKGQVIAVGNGRNIECPHDGHVLFATPSRRPASLKEEAVFITAPAQALQL